MSYKEKSYFEKQLDAKVKSDNSLASYAFLFTVKTQSELFKLRDRADKDCTLCLGEGHLGKNLTKVPFFVPEGEGPYYSPCKCVLIKIEVDKDLEKDFEE